jgi:hypothetical protein
VARACHERPARESPEPRPPGAPRPLRRPPPHQVRNRSHATAAVVSPGRGTLSSWPTSVGSAASPSSDVGSNREPRTSLVRGPRCALTRLRSTGRCRIAPRGGGRSGAREPRPTRGKPPRLRLQRNRRRAQMARSRTAGGLHGLTACGRSASSRGRPVVGDLNLSGTRAASYRNGRMCPPLRFRSPVRRFRAILRFQAAKRRARRSPRPAWGWSRDGGRRVRDRGRRHSGSRNGVAGSGNGRALVRRKLVVRRASADTRPGRLEAIASSRHWSPLVGAACLGYPSPTGSRRLASRTDTAPSARAVMARRAACYGGNPSGSSSGTKIRTWC